MNAANALGAVILLAVFGVITAAIVRQMGWRGALAAWCFTAVISGAVILGSYLLTS